MKDESGDLEPQNDVDERYKYTGQREEVSIGLYYYGVRYYDFYIGRFIDPIVFGDKFSMFNQGITDALGPELQEINKEK